MTNFKVKIHSHLFILAAVAVMVLTLILHQTVSTVTYIDSNSGVDIIRGKVLGATTNGLVGHWKFDEGSGTVAADSSGNGNNGSLVNDPIWVDGKMGKALQFDGTNDSVNIPDANSLDISGQYSITVWVKLNSTAANQVIFGRENYEQRLAVEPYFNKRFFSQFGGNLYAQNNSFTAGSWIHIAWVGSTVGQEVYINGSLSASSDTAAISFVSVRQVMIGRSGTSYAANGLIDEVRLYNRALSAQEILDVYNDTGSGQVSPTPTPTITPTPLPTAVPLATPTPTPTPTPTSSSTPTPTPTPIPTQISNPVSGNVITSLNIADNGGVARVNDPVTSGVPLRQSDNITNTNQLQMLNPSGQVIPAQFTVLARWNGTPTDSSKPIKWVLADFQANVSAGGNSTYFLARGQTAGPISRVQVSQDGGSVFVDTGPLQFRIRKDYFNFIDEAILNGQTIVSTSKNQQLSITDGPSGKVYRSSNNDSSYTVTVEQTGPMRAQIKVTGALVSDSGEKRFTYEVRFLAYAGKPIVKTYSTIIFSEDMFKFKPSNIVLDLPLQLEGSLVATAGGESGAVSSSISGSQNFYLLQDDHNHYSVRKAGVEISSGQKSKGWLDISGANGGVTVFLKDMWQAFPMELEAQGAKLRAHLWPLHGDYTAQNNAKRAQATTNQISHFWPFFGGSFLDLTAVSPTGNGAFYTSKEHNAAGIAKTYELSYLFHSGNSSSAGSDSFAKLANSSLMAVNPSWIAQSGVLGKFHPYDPDRFPKEEQALSQAFTSMVGAQERELDYGTVNYGDTHYSYFAAGGGQRYWMGYRVNWQQGVWLMYARTGDPKYLNFATNATNLILDIGTTHATMNFTDVNGNLVKKARGGVPRTHEVGVAHWHSVGSDEPFLDGAVDSLITYYYLTGYDRAKDVALERGERLLSSGSKFYQDFPSARGVLGSLGSSVPLYELTGDTRYLSYSNEVFDAMKNIVYAPGYIGDAESYDWNVFTTTWAIDEVARYARVSGRADAKETYLKIAKALGGMGITNNTSGFRTYGLSLKAFSDGYDLSGDPQFVYYGKRSFDINMALIENYLVTTGTSPDMHSVARAMLRIPFMMETLSKFSGPIQEPLLPPTFFGINLNEKVSYLFKEETDGDQTVKLVVEPDIGIFTGWQASGNVTVNIFDSSNKKVFTNTFTVVDTTSKILAGGKDNRILSFTIPKDSKADIYRLEVSADKAKHVVALVGSSMGKAVTEVPAAGINMDRGRYYFYVPDTVTSFTVVSNSVSVVVVDPSGVQNKFFATKVFTPSASQKNKLWAVITEQEYFGTPLVKITGVLPYLSVSQAGYFSPTGATVIIPVPTPTPSVTPTPTPTPSATPTPAPTSSSNNTKPTGSFDGIKPEGVIFGWAKDNDNLNLPVSVHIYIDKNAGTVGASPIGITASEFRSDVGNHAFNFTIPSQYRDNTTHQVWLWAIDLTNPANNVQITGSPKSFTLSSSSIIVRPPKTLGFSFEGTVTKSISGKIEILNSTTYVKLAEINITPDASGLVAPSIPSSTPDTVHIRIVIPGYLPKIIRNIDLTQSTPITTGDLVAGDFNNDGIINSLDYSAFSRRWNQNVTLYDINKDGVINSLDYTIISRNWNRRGE